MSNNGRVLAFVQFSNRLNVKDLSTRITGLVNGKETQGEILTQLAVQISIYFLFSVLRNYFQILFLFRDV